MWKGLLEVTHVRTLHYLIICLLAALFILPIFTTQADAHNADPKIRRLIFDMERYDSHFMVGFEFITLGVMQRDLGLGYPREAWGLNPILGITWRRYRGQPTIAEVEAAAHTVNEFYGHLHDETWRKRMKSELNARRFPYVGVATAGFILPGLDAGYSWDYADANGSGGSIVAGVTLGLYTFFFPIPYVGASYTF